MHSRRDTAGGHVRTEVTGIGASTDRCETVKKQKINHATNRETQAGFGMIRFFYFVHLTYALWGRVRLFCFCFVESGCHPGNFSGSSILMNGSFCSCLHQFLFCQSQLCFCGVKISGNDCSVKVFDDRLQMRLNSSVSRCLFCDNTDSFLC